MLPRRPERPLLPPRALQVRAEAPGPGNRDFLRLRAPDRDGEDQGPVPGSHEDDPLRCERQGRGALHQVQDEQGTCCIEIELGLDVAEVVEQGNY